MFAGKFEPESRLEKSKAIEQLCGTFTNNAGIYKPQVSCLLFENYIVSLLPPHRHYIVHCVFNVLELTSPFMYSQICLKKLRWDKSSLGDVGSNP